MIRSYLIEVGKQSAGLLVANAGWYKGHVSWTLGKHRRRLVGCSYEHSYAVSWVQSPQQNGILKGVRQMISVATLHGAEMAMGICLNLRWYVRRLRDGFR